MKGLYKYKDIKELFISLKSTSSYGFRGIFNMKTLESLLMFKKYEKIYNILILINITEYYHL